MLTPYLANLLKSLIKLNFITFVKYSLIVVSDWLTNEGKGKLGWVHGSLAMV